MIGRRFGLREDRGGQGRGHQPAVMELGADEGHSQRDPVLIDVQMELTATAPPISRIVLQRLIGQARRLPPHRCAGINTPSMDCPVHSIP